MEYLKSHKNNMPYNPNKISEQGFMALRVPVFVKSVMPGEAAQKAGLREGDRLISVDGVATPAFTELSPALLAHADKPTDLGVIRGDRKSVV